MAFAGVRGSGGRPSNAACRKFLFCRPSSSRSTERVGPRYGGVKHSRPAPARHHCGKWWYGDHKTRVRPTSSSSSYFLIDSPPRRFCVPPQPGIPFSECPISWPGAKLNTHVFLPRLPQSSDNAGLRTLGRRLKLVACPPEEWFRLLRLRKSHLSPM